MEHEGDYGPGSEFWEENAEGLDYEPEDEGTFWVSLDEYLSKFDNLVTCRTYEWSEIRVKGKFIRVKESEDSDREKVMTKFFYKLHVSETTNVFVTMH